MNTTRRNQYTTGVSPAGGSFDVRMTRHFGGVEYDTRVHNFTDRDTAVEFAEAVEMMNDDPRFDVALSTLFWGGTRDS